MAGIREVDLPAIGRKFEIELRSGDRAAVVVHDNGRREIYVFSPDDPEQAISALVLDDEEARQVAAIVGGLSYTPKALETARIALDDVVLEWCRIEPGSPVIDHTIGALQVRQRTGATIFAIIDPDHKSVVNPGPDQRISSGCTVVAAGERQHIRNLQAMIAPPAVPTPPAPEPTPNDPAS